MVSLSLFSFSALTLFSIASSVVHAGCSGNPPTFNGLACATTTRYWDGQMGACGCGTGNESPFSWQWNSHTAAGSQLIYDIGGSGWCGAGCGLCYELIPTGDCIYGSTCATYTAPITVMVTNRCPYIGNEEWCPNPGSTNEHGYSAHFDLMDYQMSGWVDALGWNNPVVTYRQVPCGNEGSPTCADALQCECQSTWQCESANSTSTSTSTSTSASTSTSTITSTSAASVVTSSSSVATSSSSGSGNNNNNNNGCSANIVQAVGSTWVGGGLVNIVISNNGSYPITQVIVNLSGSEIVSAWNLNSVSSNTYSLPSWSYPIQVGSPFTSAGYTFGSNQPTSISLESVTC